MRETMLPVKIKAAAAVMFLAVLLSADSVIAADGYFLFSGTESPDGRYAIAWGYGQPSKVSEGVKKKNSADGDFEDIVESIDRENIENYIIEISSRKIVCKLSNPDFPYMDRLEMNHFALLHAWSEDSRLLVFGLSSKWKSEFVDVYRISENGSAVRFGMLSALELEVRSFLKKEYAAGYSKYSKRIVISYSDIKIDKNGNITVIANVEIPKENYFYFTLKIQAQADFSEAGRIRFLSSAVQKQGGSN